MNFDVSMFACPLGVLPPIGAPDSAPGSPGECVQRGSPAAGTGRMVWVNACVAVPPAASVTRMVNANVPVCDGTPISVPFGCSIVPGGSVPAATENVAGAGKSPAALKLAK